MSNYILFQTKKKTSLKGQERVIEINRCLGSSHYVNALGGLSLYQERDFVEHLLELSFLRIKNIQYPQFAELFVPDLSIIDVLMFNGVGGTTKLLAEYDLIKAEAYQDGR